ncbi:MAG TPA: hypothetical protein VMU51_33130 [Mycobacteriales bacterium]|nr:hypothetical protein [Mycobacteriales bacterium]
MRSVSSNATRASWRGSSTVAAARLTCGSASSRSRDRSAAATLVCRLVAPRVSAADSARSNSARTQRIRCVQPCSTAIACARPACRDAAAR